MFSKNGAAIMMGSGFNKPAEPQKIMLNIEDVILHEQKLFNILEVSPLPS